jgi:glycosyltransferase involved in cell wall biosynthesis
MHIGIFSRLQPGNFTAHLHPADAETARTIKGHLNTALVNLIPELLARGHRITVFNVIPSVAAPLVLKGDRLTLRLFPARHKNSHPAFNGYRPERRALVQAALEARPDILHAHWTHDGHASAALDTGLPAVVTERGMRLDSLAFSGKFGLSTLGTALAELALTWSVCRRTRFMSAVSPQTVDHLRRFFLYRRPVEVIPNAFPFDAWRPLLNGPRHAYNPDAPVFADIARWGSLKNTETLLKAFAAVRAAKPGARLILFGNGLGPGGAAEPWARKHDLGGGVQFRGPLPYAALMGELASDCDFLVHLSRLETFCNTVCEALAFDRPVIAGNVGGIAWATESLPVTFVKNVLDVREVAAAMLNLARTHDPARPRHWVSVLEKRYAPAMIAEQTERYYERVLKEWPG